MKTVVGYYKGLGKREFKLALYAWIVNALVSASILYGLHAYFTGASGDPLSDKGTYYFWLSTFINDLSRVSSGSVTALALSGAAVLLLLLFLSIFLSGGAYSLLLREENASLFLFLASSARNFPKMFRVLLANLLNFIAASVLPAILFYAHYKKQSATLDETLLAVFIYGWGALSAIIFIYSSAVYDLSRIIALKGDRGPFAALKGGVKTVFARKGSVLAVFLVYLFTVALLFLAYAGGAGLMKEPSLWVALALFQQAVLFLRYFGKVMLMRAEIGIASEGP